MTGLILLALLAVIAPLGAVWVVRGAGSKRSRIEYMLLHAAGRIPIVRIWNPNRRSWRQAVNVWGWMIGFFPIGIILRARPPEGRYEWRVITRNGLR
jgi:hypothetical protein